MDTEKGHIKIEDIAKKAGVSNTAVSFAINGKAGISDKTRAKILGIIKESGYIAKPLVRSDEKPNGKQTKTVLLLYCSRTPATSGDFDKAPFFSQLIKFLEKQVGEHGYRFWIKSIHIDGSFRENVRELLADENITGILLISTDMRDRDVEFLLGIQPNIVAIDAIFRSLDINCIVTDNYLGGVLAAKHLLEKGHCRIGYVQSKERINNFDMRRAGFFDTLAKSSAAVDPQFVFDVKGNTIDASFETLSAVFGNNNGDLPTAFFAENDYLAIGLIKALQHNGVDVPQRVAVIGFDNIEIASFITPGLSTLHVPIEKIADLSLRTLVGAMEQKKPCTIKQLVGVELIERSSTKTGAAGE